MSQLECNKCKRIFKSNRSLTYHFRRCDGSGFVESRRKRILQRKPRQKCPRCNRDILINTFDVHIRNCDGLGSRKNRKKKTKEEISKALSIGVKNRYDNDPEYSKKISAALKGKSTGRALTKEKEKIRRDKIRNSILKRYENGWQVKCGRSSKFEYISSIAGTVKLDGSWELKVAKYLDENKINWKRNTKRFEYTNLQNTKSTYCPDFWIEDWNSYLEIKGYETDLDKCKWKQFKENLIVWKKEDLIRLKILFGRQSNIGSSR